MRDVHLYRALQANDTRTREAMNEKSEEIDVCADALSALAEEDPKRAKLAQQLQILTEQLSALGEQSYQWNMQMRAALLGKTTVMLNVVGCPAPSCQHGLVLFSGGHDRAVACTGDADETQAHSRLDGAMATTSWLQPSPVCCVTKTGEQGAKRCWLDMPCFGMLAQDTTASPTADPCASEVRADTEAREAKDKDV